MIKNIFRIAVLLTIVGCLAGCVPQKPMYEPADADQVAAEGSEIMQAWLAEYLPDAELTECEAYMVNPLRGRGEYLTDYAEGYIRSGETTTGFMVNTVSGAVYFKTDSETQAKLNEAAESYIREITGLSADRTGDRYFLCNVMLPVRDGDSVNEIPGVEYFGAYWYGVCVLPAGTDTENLDAFVRDPQSRPMLEIMGYFTLPEGADPTDYDPEEIKKQLEEEHGLHCLRLDILG